jgi:hypothetical protein
VNRPETAAHIEQARRAAAVKSTPEKATPTWRLHIQGGDGRSADVGKIVCTIANGQGVLAGIVYAVEKPR